MDDRTLLEKAAKAAGLDVYNGRKDYFFVWIDGNELEEWNPLTDDGDNRRLQVALRLGLIPIEGGAWDVTRYDAERNAERTLASDVDPKRAVVRAAAALAEQRTGGRE